MFSWSHEEMPSIDLDHKVIQQNRRVFASKRYEAMKTNVDKLLKVDFIKNVDYSTWFANVMLIKKANGYWRMCIDFTNLNKTCPKNNFLLPKINQLMDATTSVVCRCNGWPQAIELYRCMFRVQLDLDA